MAVPTIVIGLLLMAVGAAGYWQPELLGKPTAGTSPTALIPAAFGGVLVLCGLIALAAPNARKHVMHFAAVIGLLGFVGGLMRPVMVLAKGGTLDWEGAPLRSQVLLVGLSLLFVLLCVNSFVQARRRRASGPGAPTT